MVTESSELLRWIPLLPLLAAVVPRRDARRWCAARRRARSRSRSPAARWWPPSWSPASRSSSCSSFPTTSACWSTTSTPGSAPASATQAFSAELALPARSALGRDGAGRHRASASLIHIYSIGYMDDDHREDKGLPALLLLPEPLHVLDARAGAGRQPGADVRRLGGRRPLLLSADRLLVRRPLERLLRQQGVHREPHRRLRLPARDLPALRGARATRARRRSPSRDHAELRRDRASARSRCRPGSRSAPSWRLVERDRALLLRRRLRASRRSSRSTSGCPTRWPARRPSRR